MKNRKEIQLALCKSEEEKEWKYISALHTHAHRFFFEVHGAAMSFCTHTHGGFFGQKE